MNLDLLLQFRNHVLVFLSNPQFQKAILRWFKINEWNRFIEDSEREMKGLFICYLARIYDIDSCILENYFDGFLIEKDLDGSFSINEFEYKIEKILKDEMSCNDILLDRTLLAGDNVVVERGLI